LWLSVIVRVRPERIATKSVDKIGPDLKECGGDTLLVSEAGKEKEDDDL